MSEIDQGGFVYPHSITEEFDSGITRRDWLAGLAMQGLIASCGENQKYAPAGEIAHASYLYADAMIAEGKKG